MKALSFSRPWDYLVLHEPFKDVENRPWKTKFRGRIYVHRANSVDHEGWEWIVGNATELGISGHALDLMRELMVVKPYPMHSSGLVGEVTVIDCVDHSGSYWFFGPNALIFTKPVAYDQHIPYRGMPGLFDVRLCHQCKKPLFTSGKFCPKCAEVALEDDCAPD